MIYWMKTRSLAIREVLNWFQNKRICRAEKDSPVWQQYRLSTGYIGQIYTVVSLRKEDMGDDEKVQKVKVLEKIEPINTYIDSLKLGETVYPVYSKLPETRSWLIVYWPLFNNFRIWRLIFQIIVVTVILTTGIIPIAIDFIKSLL